MDESGKKTGRLLVAAGLITEELLDKAEHQQKKAGRRTGPANTARMAIAPTSTTPFDFIVSPPFFFCRRCKGHANPEARDADLR